jgi:hypothetical protein
MQANKKEPTNEELIATFVALTFDVVCKILDSIFNGKGRTRKTKKGELG